MEADLGSGLYKKRVATGNKGKSSGFRTLIGAVIGEKYFFLYAFAKNKRANISYQEKFALRELAQTVINFEQQEFQRLIDAGELIKVDAHVVKHNVVKNSVVKNSAVKNSVLENSTVEDSLAKEKPNRKKQKTRSRTKKEKNHE